MLAEIIIALLLGIFAGTITGLVPGIHINLVGAILVSLTASLLFPLEPVYLIVFVTSMAITHTFLDFIPSILLGCPDSDTELSTLPGHELLKQGKGYFAIMLTAYGSLAATFLTVIFAFPLVYILPKFQNIIKDYIGYLLLLISIILILIENKKLKAIVVFALTGILGYLVLNSQIKEPLLPLLSGLFGASLLIISLKQKTELPKQKITLEKTKIFKPVLASLISSPLCAFLPGLGSGQAAIIGNQISQTDKKGFLVLLGATNTLVMGFSFIALYAISKTRTGAAATIKNIMQLSYSHLLIILATILISGIISFYLTKGLAKFFVRNMAKVSYSKLSYTTIIILMVIVFLVAGFSGIVVLFVSTLTGIYCISMNVRRTLMMGCLLVPTIVIYLF